ncbi:uncharacterized protein LOC123548751 [Mercenaria mercenaria]|uniref:uncharacterized protein LOC123548751 n=1 Tax=Mercenaria mercenaria TaxID=6596 RepID=UPI00234E4AA2|nr:uncharacterized protein LOC123548751 [Mercenaria mercenaria]XP_045192207.2 uncharacterized protein LOC123548751 [Mercenaria mercenaria]XP_045192208.2 uncharacterized protein LOC123548751 [Mercenaria mercenaria]
MEMYTEDATRQSEQAMELLQKEQQGDVENNLKNSPAAKLTKTDFSTLDGAKTASNGKCWLLKTCLICVCAGVAVCVFLFLAQRINKLESKIEAEMDKQQSSSESSVPRFEAMRSQLTGIYLLTNETLPGMKSMEQPKYFASDNHTRQKNVSIDQNTLKSETRMQEETSENDMALRKYYFNIGMREDSMMQDCQNSHMKHSFPDIDYAFLGYDIYRGYPLAHGHDPGFTYPIFDADYSHGKQTADCRYSVPKGLVVVPDVSCVTSFTSDVIETSKELNRDLSTNAGVSGDGFGVAFSASAGYKQVFSDLSSHESVYIISSAHCNYYYSKFQKENPPPFTDIFVGWIRRLNSSISKAPYLDFFDTFGTHFAKEITFGARYLYEHKMKSSMYKKKREQGINVAAQASYSGLIRVSGGFSLSVEQRQEASQFSKSVETKTITVGAAPPANGDAMTWASTVQNNPVPSKYKLEPIESLFREDYMGYLDVDYETISVNIKTFKEEYYKRLVPDELQRHIEFLSDGRVTKTLTVENGGSYGLWFTPQFCPVGTFAIGFNMKYEENQGIDGDNTALNAVSLQCADRNGVRRTLQRLVQSAAGHRGQWTGDVFCPKNKHIPLFLQRFALRVQPEKQTGDDTMANLVRFSCNDLHWTQNLQELANPIVGAEGQYGKWSEKCPTGSAICGIQTRIEGHLSKGDNTALNDVRFFCCDST